LALIVLLLLSVWAKQMHKLTVVFEYTDGRARDSGTQNQRRMIELIT